MKKDEIKMLTITIILIFLTMFIPIIITNTMNNIPKKEIVKQYTYKEKGVTYKVTIEKISNQ